MYRSCKKEESFKTAVTFLAVPTVLLGIAVLLSGYEDPFQNIPLKEGGAEGSTTPTEQKPFFNSSHKDGFMRWMTVLDDAVSEHNRLTAEVGYISNSFTSFIEREEIYGSFTNDNLADFFETTIAKYHHILPHLSEMIEYSKHTEEALVGVLGKGDHQHEEMLNGIRNAREYFEKELKVAEERVASFEERVRELQEKIERSSQGGASTFFADEGAVGRYGSTLEKEIRGTVNEIDKKEFSAHIARVTEGADTYLFLGEASRNSGQVHILSGRTPLPLTPLLGDQVTETGALRMKWADSSYLEPEKARIVSDIRDLSVQEGWVDNMRVTDTSVFDHPLFRAVSSFDRPSFSFHHNGLAADFSPGFFEWYERDEAMGYLKTFLYYEAHNTDPYFRVVFELPPTEYFRSVMREAASLVYEKSNGISGYDSKEEYMDAAEKKLKGVASHGTGNHIHIEYRNREITKFRSLLVPPGEKEIAPPPLPPARNLSLREVVLAFSYATCFVECERHSGCREKGRVSGDAPNTEARYCVSAGN